MKIAELGIKNPLNGEHWKITQHEINGFQQNVRQAIGRLYGNPAGLSAQKFVVPVSSIELNEQGSVRMEYLPEGKQPYGFDDERGGLFRSTRHVITEPALRVLCGMVGMSPESIDRHTTRSFVAEFNKEMADRVGIFVAMTVINNQIAMVHANTEVFCQDLSMVFFNLYHKLPHHIRYMMSWEYSTDSRLTSTMLGWFTNEDGWKEGFRLSHNWLETSNANVFKFILLPDKPYYLSLTPTMRRFKNGKSSTLFLSSVSCYINDLIQTEITDEDKEMANSISIKYESKDPKLADMLANIVISSTNSVSPDAIRDAFNGTTVWAGYHKATSLVEPYVGLAGLASIARTVREKVEKYDLQLQ